MPFLRLDGQKVRDLRLRRALSQEIFAEQCAVDRRAIGRAEASRPISLPTARAIFKTLRVRQPEQFVLEVLQERPFASDRTNKQKGESDGKES